MPEIIDLSHSIAPDTPSYPGDPATEMEWAQRIDRDGCNVSKLTLCAHIGTHMDAPLHFIPDGRPVDQIPLNRLYGPASLIDFAPGYQLEPSTPLTPEMFAKHDDLFTPGARVLFRTGWYNRFGSAGFYDGYPFITNAAADWIAERRIGLLGMDMPSPNPDPVHVHKALLSPGVEIVIVESLTNLDRLPHTFVFIGFPLKLNGSDGSPIRAAALVE